ncbi:hypothetical protein GQR58_011451 [Nymphon striatum]|nr:hypothetical protein GQR58_011451 [Nymphon striatum]
MESNLDHLLSNRRVMLLYRKTVTNVYWNLILQKFQYLLLSSPLDIFYCRNVFFQMRTPDLIRIFNMWSNQRHVQQFEAFYTHFSNLLRSWTNGQKSKIIEGVLICLSVRKKTKSCHKRGKVRMDPRNKSLFVMALAAHHDLPSNENRDTNNPIVLVTPPRKSGKYVGLGSINEEIVLLSPRQIESESSLPVDTIIEFRHHCFISKFCFTKLKLDAKIRELEMNYDILKEQVCVNSCSTKNTDGSFTDNLRMCVVELSGLEVAVEKVSRQLFNTDHRKGDVPSSTTVQSIVDEGHYIAKTGVSTAMELLEGNRRS